MNNYLIPIEDLIAHYYDPSSIESIVAYAQKMQSKTLRPFLDIDEITLTEENKGNFGNLLEEAYFKIKNNNDSRPDIPESGVEIKSGQVWLKKEKGARFPSDVIKERLKISMIDYMGGFESSCLLESEVWLKIEKILLLLFHRDSAELRIDQHCVYTDLIRWDQDDINQMSQDWLHIKNMVVGGKANELSEGHTWYLGACTAGAKASNTTEAPKGVKAKVRAFSLRNSYLNYKLGYRKTIQGPKVILKPSMGQTLDDYILSNMLQFFDKPLDEIAALIKRPELSATDAKNKTSKVARMLLEEVAGKPTKNVVTNFEQFKKAGVIEKAIVLEKTGTLKESVSFPAFRWQEIEKEDSWEDSELYSILTSKFFFAVFKKASLGLPIFKGCFFWTMPKDDIDIMESVWKDTRDKVRAGIYSNFIKISECPIGHVRPHGTKGETFPTSQGGVEGKKSFWLNSHYIKSIVYKELNI